MIYSSDKGCAKRLKIGKLRPPHYLENFAILHRVDTTFFELDGGALLDASSDISYFCGVQVSRIHISLKTPIDSPGAGARRHRHVAYEEAHAADSRQ